MIEKAGAGDDLPYTLLTNPKMLETFIKFQLAFIVSYEAGVFFPKISILFLLLRIFIDKSYRIYTYMLMGILTATFVGVIVTASLQCQPMGYYWLRTIDPSYEGHCINLRVFWRWASFPNIITDVAMLLLPLPILFTVMMSKTDRIGLTFTFALGSM